METFEQQNVQKITGLLEKIDYLSTELALKKGENESLQKNLDMALTDLSIKNKAHCKKLNSIFRASDLNEQEEIAKNLILEEKVETLEKKIQQLKQKYLDV